MKHHFFILIERKMECHDQTFIMQNFIYVMNEDRNRDQIMRYHIHRSNQKKSHAWMGTWVVREHKDGLAEDGVDLSTRISRAKRKMEKTPITMFTVCLVYEEHLVHYVAFLYVSEARRLISFDPGVQIYLHGQKTIVPRIEKYFRNQGLIDSDVRLGSCHQFRWKGKRMGVQFTGLKDRPDAFCQTWTIYFLVRFLHSRSMKVDHIRAFVREWCKIIPKKRAVMLTEEFIIPTLMYFPRILKDLKTMTDHNDPNVLMTKIITCKSRG